MGAYFLLPSEPAKPGYKDAAGNLWGLDLDTAVLTPLGTVDGFYFEQTNCVGPALMQLETAGALQTPRGSVFKRGSSEFRARKGAIRTNPVSTLSGRAELSSPCSNSPNTIYGVVTATENPVVSAPVTTWAAPLWLSF